MLGGGGRGGAGVEDARWPKSIFINVLIERRLWDGCASEADKEFRRIRKATFLLSD